MYDPQFVAFRIKRRAKELKIPMRTLLQDCGLGINAVSQLAGGSIMSYVSLALIADCLDCSVDFLLGRTERPEVSR